MINCSKKDFCKALFSQISILIYSVLEELTYVLVDCDTPYCSKCTGPGIMPGTCLGCKSGFYILSGTGICAPCLDLGCDSCLWTGMRQCTSCKANFYLQDNECTPCSFGMTSKIGSQHCEIANSSIVAIGVIGVLAAAVVIYLKKQPKSLSPQPKR